MYRVYEKGRLWLFIVLLLCGCFFIPLIIIAPGGVDLGFLITIIVITAASVTGIILEAKKIKVPEEKTQAMLVETGFGGDLQSTNIKDMINVTFCATFEFPNGTTNVLHFHSSKLNKMLLSYKDTNLEIYYKEVKEKYWLIGFNSAI